MSQQHGAWGHSIYVAMNDSGLIKIGCSRNPTRRVMELNREEKRKRGARAEKIFLKFSHEIERNAFAVERAVHGHLAPYQVEDEWFSVDLSHAESTVLAAADMVAAGIDPGMPRLKGRGGADRLGRQRPPHRVSDGRTFPRPVDLRLDYIDRRMLIEGTLRRIDIMQAFAVSQTQASGDIARFLRLYPHVMRYDMHTKRYVPATAPYYSVRELTAPSS